MDKVAYAILVAGMALVAVPSANAALVVQTNLFSPPPVPGTATSIAIQGASGTAPVNGAGFSITFTGVPAGQGVVQGDAFNLNAIPVAGVTGSNQEQYLVGDFGSPLTTSEAASGRYLSTGGTGSAISISFNTTQSALGLLWGSIDFSNQIEFFNDATSVGSVTGTTVQATPGFVGNGNQGPGGSSYVTVNSTLAFNRVVATSNVVSFEFAGVIGSSQAINVPEINVPEPVSLALLGSGLVMAGLIRRRRA